MCGCYSWFHFIIREFTGAQLFADAKEWLSNLISIGTYINEVFRRVGSPRSIKWVGAAQQGYSIYYTLINLLARKVLIQNFVQLTYVKLNNWRSIRNWEIYHIQKLNESVIFYFQEKCRLGKESNLNINEIKRYLLVRDRWKWDNHCGFVRMIISIACFIIFAITRIWENVTMKNLVIWGTRVKKMIPMWLWEVIKKIACLLGRLMSKMLKLINKKSKIHSGQSKPRK